MKNFTRVLLCLLIFNSLILSEAASLPFRNHIFTSANGLPGNTVYDIASDSRGYLFVGTENGLAQFDGTQFTVNNKWNTPEFSSNTVKSIISSGPFLYIRLKTGQIIVKSESSLSEIPISENIQFKGWARDVNDNIWVVSNNSCGILSPSGFRNIVSGSSIAFNGVWPHFTEGVIILTENNSLLHVTEKQSMPIPLPEDIADKTIHSVFHSSEHIIVLGTDSEAVFLDLSNGTSVSELIESIGPVQHIAYDTVADRYWCSGPGGLFFRSSGIWEKPSLNLGLPSEIITCIKLGSSGILWAGTENGGIVCIQDSFIQTPPLLSRELRFAVSRGENCIYTATDSGIKKIKVNCSQNSFIIEKNIISPQPNTLLEDSEHGLWIGTDSGLYLFLDNRLRKIQGVEASVYCLLNASDNSSIFAGSSAGVFQIFKDLSVVQYNQWKPYAVTSLSEDSSGSLWAGTLKNGIIHFADDSMERFDVTDGLFSNSIHSLFRDSRDRIWICHSEESVQLIVENQVHDIHIKNQPQGTLVKAATEDDINNIWLASHTGLIVIHAEDIEKIPLNTGVKASIINEYDGMPSAECTGTLFSTAGMTEDGYILTDTIKGMALIHLNQWNQSVKRSDCFLTLQSIRVNNTPVSSTKALTVEEGAALQFFLNPFSFSAPGNMTLSYTLDGFSDEWKTSTTQNDNNLFYLNIKKGSYVLKATALNRWGREKSIEFPLHVSGTSLLPTFFFTGFLTAVCVLLFILMRKKHRETALSSEKYASSGLDETEGQQQYDRLNNLMETQQLFLQQGITLNGVSEEMGIHPKHLSQIVNQFSGFNFNDYINFHRVEEAKRILSDSSYNSLTLLAIGEECGFNSKTSFNTAFKKHTGVTPSQFRKTSNYS